MAGGASRVGGRARPHGVKGCGLRRGKVATGHSEYANNNPYGYIDPDGRRERDPRSIEDMHPSTRNEVQTFRMNPDSGNGAVQNGAQGNQTNNLSYKNGVPAAEGAIKQQIECIAAICSDVDMVVTSTNENIPQHKPGTPHRRSEAADLRVPKGEENHVLVCSSACGGGFGLN